MAHAILDGRRIGSRPAFHVECARAFGFPDFYGKNMDAWIDCMRSLREGDGMTRFSLADNETLVIEVQNSKSVPEPILDALQDCIEEVNEEFEAEGRNPALELRLR